MTIVAGVDVGTNDTKVALVNDSREILATACLPTGSDPADVAGEVIDKALEQACVSRHDLSYTVSTGFARSMVPFRNIQLTDFTCHGLGALHYFPKARTILDIGSQGTRACRIAPNGRVTEFKLNDKCAAGAGMFLVRTARFLHIRLEDMGDLYLKSTKTAQISSVCTVLGETEIINHLTAGTALEDIVGGVVSSLAHRAVVLLKRIGVEEEVTLTGGTARNIGMVRALEDALKMKVNTSTNGQDGSFFAGAVGAALAGHLRLQNLKA